MNKQEARPLIPSSVQETLLDSTSMGYAVLEKPPAGTIGEVTLVGKLSKIPNAEFISCGKSNIFVFDGSRFEGARVIDNVLLEEIHERVNDALSNGFEVHAIQGERNGGFLKKDTCSLVLLRSVNPSKT
ncbi:MAG TPA: hypothetical protein VFD45_00455 [Patescibacteria group bacterium]|nr:hypothetical protein [Patescibacteria group bacterium]